MISTIITENCPFGDIEPDSVCGAVKTTEDCQRNNMSKRCCHTCCPIIGPRPGNTCTSTRTLTFELLIRIKDIKTQTFSCDDPNLQDPTSITHQLFAVSLLLLLSLLLALYFFLPNSS